MNERLDESTREKADIIASEMREIIQTEFDIDTATKYFYEFRMFAYDVIEGETANFNYRKYKKERKDIFYSRRI